MVPKYPIESGYSKNGLPYVKIGNKSKILINIEALSFKHEPVSGYEIKLLRKNFPPLLEDYTVYNIGRRPNLPLGYTFDQMASDYAEMIRNELGFPVDIMGSSTGGQLCHYLAADYPDLIRKVVMISTAYRLSDQGVIVERETAEWFQKKNYRKVLTTLMKAVMPPGISRSFLLCFIALFSPLMLKNIIYPNDFLCEVEADRSMNFLNRLKEIRAPTLILCGENDNFYAKADIQATAAGIPHSELKFYPGYGHNLSMAKMHILIKEIKAFLLRS